MRTLAIFLLACSVCRADALSLALAVARAKAELAAADAAALAEAPSRPAALRTAPGRGVGEPATSPANVPHDEPVRAAAGGAIKQPAVVYGWYETRECNGSRCVTTRRYGPLDAATMKPLTNSQGTTH